jgi:hypothetical protein
MSNTKTQTTLGDVYGQMLNNVKRQVVKEQKHPSEDIGDAPLLKGGPQTTAGYMEPVLDKKKLSDKELEDNLYNIDDLSEDETSDDHDEDEESKFGKNSSETQKIARESLNNFMKKKSYFDQIYENVFYGGEENQEELDALGIDDSGEEDLGEGGEDQVNVTFDRATAQMICDILQGALATGEEDAGDEGEVEDFGAEEDEMSEFEAEEDEESIAPSQLKPVNFGKDNKVGSVKPVGRSASTKFTDKVGNDGEHGHSLYNAKQPNMGTNNKVSTLKVNQGAFQQ